MSYSSLTKLTSMTSFFSKKHYTTIAVVHLLWDYRITYVWKTLSKQCFSIHHLSFNQSLFSENDFIKPHFFRGIPYIVLNFGNSLHSIHKEFFKQYLPSIYLICTQLPSFFLHESILLKKFSVIHITRSEHKIIGYHLHMLSYF